MAYTHKAHEKIIDRLNARLLAEKRAKAVLLTLTAGNTVGVLVSSARWAEVVSVVLAGLALLVEVYGLSRARERLVEQHRLAAHRLWTLRERYVHLIGDIASGAATEAEGRAARDELTAQVAQVYAAAPATDGRAYADAQRALKRNEELTFAPWEIDVRLPHALRSAPLPAPARPEAGPWWRGHR